MSKRKPTIAILYHANCLDGAMAAVCLMRGIADPYVAALAVNYGSVNTAALLKDLEGMQVYIVDFSFDVDTTRKICEVAEHVYFMDHHKTAIDRFAGLTAADVAPNLTMILNNDKSGAQLAWEYYTHHMIPDTHEDYQAPEPWFVAHVGDRDLWKFELPNTPQVTAALYTAVGNVQTLSDYTYNSVEDMITLGTILTEKAHEEITQSVSRAYRGTVAGYSVPLVNAHAHQSEIGNILSAGEPFAAVWYVASDEMRVSLRSQKNTGIDVEAIAKLFGGGGHKNAAGFTIPVVHPIEFIPENLQH